MSETIVQGKPAVAEYFHTTVRTIRNWIKDGMPCLGGDRYDLAQIDAWRRQKKGGRGPGVKSDPLTHGQSSLIAEGDKDYWDMRSKKAQAEQREMALRERRAELVEWAKVDKLWGARSMAYRTSMLGLARLLPPLLIHCANEREMEAVIMRVAREHLENICRPMPKKFGGEGEEK